MQAEEPPENPKKGGPGAPKGSAAGPKRGGQNAVWRFFWGCHQRFFRHLCMAAKVPALVRLSKVGFPQDRVS